MEVRLEEIDLEEAVLLYAKIKLGVSPPKSRQVYFYNGTEKVDYDVWCRITEEKEE